MKHGPRDRRRPEEKPDFPSPQEDEADPESSGARSEASPPDPQEPAGARGSPAREPAPDGEDSDDSPDGSTHQTGGFFF